MMQDFLQIAQLMKGRNPEEVAMNMIENNKIVDPMIVQMVDYAKTGNTNSLMNLATTFFERQGINFGQEFQSFMSLIK